MKSLLFCLKFFMIFVGYFLFAKLGLMLASLNSNSSPVWPASGLAICSLYISGLRYWPAIFLGAFVGNSLAGSASLVNIAIAAGNSLEAILGVFLFGFLFEKNFFKFNKSIVAIVMTAIFSPIPSFLLGNFALFTHGIIPAKAVLPSMFTWWIGDALGAIYFLPLLAFGVTEKSFIGMIKNLLSGFRPLLFIVACVLSVNLFKFNSIHGIVFTLLLLPLISILYFDILTTIITAIIIAGSGVYITLTDVNVFNVGSINDNLINLQIFLAGLLITTISLKDLLSSKRKWLVVIVLIGGWICAGLVYRTFRSNEDFRDYTHFQDLIRTSQDKIFDRLETYQNVLIAGSGLFAATEVITSQQWRAFVETLALSKRYPGIRGIGVIFPVLENELQNYERKMQSDYHRDFKIHSLQKENISSDHFIISYIEPKEKNKNALGLDVASEKNRRDAAIFARDMNKITMTKTITLVQDEKKGFGTLLYVPMFDRFGSFKCWAYAPFTDEEFFGNILFEINEIYISISDNLGNILYSTFPKEQVDSFANKSSINLAGRELNLKWAKSASFVSARDANGALVAFVALCVVLLIASVILMLQESENKAINIADESMRSLMTERQIAAERIAQSERRLQFALEGSSDGIWDWDLVLGEMYISDKLAKRFGSPDSIALKSASEMAGIIHPDDFNAVKASIEGHLSGARDIHESEARLRMADGSWCWFLTRGKISDRDGAGKPARFTGVHIDISKQKETEAKLTSAMEAKSRFLATMSHEIRTPLNGVLAIAELLSGTTLDAKQREYIHLINQSGHTLMSIINDVLDLAKIESGQLILEKIEFSLKDVVKAKIDLLELNARKKNIYISMGNLDEDKMRIGDSGKIGQIILNLLSNAIKFTNYGSISLNVEKIDKNIVRFEISDTGIGLKETQIEKIFKPFEQGDDSTSRKYGGTGLGLTICKRLIDLMGGKIGVKSKFGVGSTFWFEVSLPIGSLIKEDTAVLVKEIKITHGRILVAEDNPVNQEVIKGHLERLQQDFIIVKNGKEAVSILQKESFDLILMDCQMPEMDGYEATQQIRSNKKSRMHDIPIIALTANAVEGDKEKCLHAGMDDYLTKPIKGKILAEKISFWLNNKNKNYGIESDV